MEIHQPFPDSWQQQSAKTIADIFPPWHCINKELNAPDQQTAKTSAVIEVITLADDQLIMCIRLAVNSCYLTS